MQANAAQFHVGESAHRLLPRLRRALLLLLVRLALAWCIALLLITLRSFNAFESTRTSSTHAGTLR